ncbi:Protein of unknown function [Alteribacillus bidgolensis]|uniref:Uncharacterized protein n=1 Tax=Alteribacillus bidgolensis TaxID=930129 RepID=A0A1G8EMI3_9BACI|nr:Protein of unknown function [Alteribacillus bidgolensis]
MPLVVVPLGAAIHLNFFTTIIGLTFVSGYLDLLFSSFGNHGSHTKLKELVTVCRSPLCAHRIFYSLGKFNFAKGSKYKQNYDFHHKDLAVSRVFLIWIAGNIATFFGAWEYPNQTDAWSLVHLEKVSSWLFLVIVSFFLIVVTLKQVIGKIP